MKKKQFEYAMQGLIIGLLIGAVLGFAELNFINKSQRGAVAIPAIAITAIICAASGYSVGSSKGKLAFIKQRTGLDNINTGYYKDGRYWIGQSTWKDNRAGQEFKIETKRENGILCSSINGQIFKNHGIPNANQQTVPRFHKAAVEEVSQKIIDGFEEGKEQLLQL